MSAKGKKRKGTRPTEIAVVVVHPTAPNRDVLETVYQIFVANKIA